MIGQVNFFFTLLTVTVHTENNIMTRYALCKFVGSNKVRTQVNNPKL